MKNFQFGNSNLDYFEERKFMDIANKSEKTPEEREFYEKTLDRTNVWATNDNGYKVKLNDD